ncbi:hypothetical protein WA026_006757 [Henosepilachna vigintioctopunctata]|uniref:Uncharacterized protein n=1 Tax=Henosepilachna vigintioctopunctata TaxID=420089 RepID=A0AAW1UAM4_9CUCU
MQLTIRISVSEVIESTYSEDQQRGQYSPPSSHQGVVNTQTSPHSDSATPTPIEECLAYGSVVDHDHDVVGYPTVMRVGVEDGGGGHYMLFNTTGGRLEEVGIEETQSADYLQLGNPHTGVPNGSPNGSVTSNSGSPRRDFKFTNLNSIHATEEHNSQLTQLTNHISYAGIDVPNLPK